MKNKVITTAYAKASSNSHKVHTSMDLMNDSFLSFPPITNSFPESGTNAQTHLSRGMGSLDTLTHSSVTGRYTAIDDEGGFPPTASSVPWNDVMAGLLVSVRGSCCHLKDGLLESTCHTSAGMEALTTLSSHAMYKVCSMAVRDGRVASLGRGNIVYQ